MDLDELTACVAPSRVVGAEAGAVVVTDLAVDVRRVGAGAAFFCIRGSGVDGHAFAAEAVARGAVAVVCERPLTIDQPQLVVPDARTALALASGAFWGRPTETLPVVGITGTSGKTTTAYLLCSILAAAGLRPGLRGTVETWVGDERTPSRPESPAAFALQRTRRAMLDAGNRSCAIEATSYDSILRRLEGIRFAALVFTNLGHDHLDVHRTLERYYRAKRRLFVRGTPPAAVNVRDRFGRRLAAELRERGRAVLGFGLARGADVVAEDVRVGPGGSSFRVGRLELRTPLQGAFNVENALAAVAAARLVGVGDDAIAAGVAALDGVPGRMERVDEGQPFAVFVDYAHKPEALAAALRAVRRVAERRVICVFGCGGDAYRGKRAEMGRIARRLADVVVVTTDNPRDEDPQAIVDDIRAGGAPDEICLDRRQAISRALERAGRGDAVLVAGRGHEQAQQLADGRTRPFDDRAVVRELLRCLHGGGCPAVPGR